MNTGEQIAEAFLEFAAIDSPTGEEKNFSDHLRTRIGSSGFDSYQDERGNILVQIAGKGEPLLLAAHIDTVEPGRGIRPQLKDGIFKSDGSTILGADNKAIVSVLFVLLQFLKNREEHRPLDVLFSVGEEGGVSGATTFDIEKLKAREGLCFDTVRPPVELITLGSPSYLRITITLIGESAHASLVGSKGKSVVEAAGSLLSKIPHGRVSGDTLVNLGIIEGGHAANTQLGELKLVGEIRSFKEEEMRKVTSKFTSLLQKIEKKFSIRSVCETKLENEGYVFEKSDPMIRRIADVMRNVYPDEVEYERSWSIADANEFNRRGIKTVNLGYGVLNPHTTEEQIRLSDLEKVFQFILAYVT